MSLKHIAPGSVTLAGQTFLGQELIGGCYDSQYFTWEMNHRFENESSDWRKWSNYMFENYVWGEGIPLIEKIKYNCSSSFSWIEKFQEVHFMFFDRYWSQIQDSQEFIRRIFRIFGPRLFHEFRFPRCENFPTSYFKKWFGISLACFEVIWWVQSQA